MKLVIIKYNAGNIQSVLYSMDRLGVAAKVTDDPLEISTADKVIFPGVGEASSAMKYLKERKLDQVIVSLKQPVLGICLGMQLMCSFSEENNTKCLNLFSNQVKLFTTDLKVPEVGWNTIYDLKSPLFKGIDENSHTYFVHSYYAAIGISTSAKTNYGIEFSSSLHQDNFYGVQFHPEKSASVGQKILRNFIEFI